MTTRLQYYEVIMGRYETWQKGHLIVRVLVHYNVYGSQMQCTNTLATGRFDWNFKYVIFKLNIGIFDRGISSDFALDECCWTLLMISHIVPGNGFVPAGIWPLPVHILPQIFVVIWRRLAWSTQFDVQVVTSGDKYVPSVSSILIS